MIGKTISHYHVTGALGAGGRSEVYRASDTKLGRLVAFKLMSARTFALLVALLLALAARAQKVEDLKPQGYVSHFASLLDP